MSTPFERETFSRDDLLDWLETAAPPPQEVMEDPHFQAISLLAQCAAREAIDLKDQLGELIAFIEGLPAPEGAAVDGKQSLLNRLRDIRSTQVDVVAVAL